MRPWLYRIARNRCLNHLRRPVPDGQDSMDTMPGENGVTTAERVQTREDFRALVTDVGELPETQRTALLLREIDALSYEEIAQTMETTVPAVKSLLVRARMSLAEATQSRQLTCGDVRLELAEAVEGLRKASGPVRHHVKRCEPCREFRGELRYELQGARRAGAARARSRFCTRADHRQARRPSAAPARPRRRRCRDRRAAGGRRQRRRRRNRRRAAGAGGSAAAGAGAAAAAEPRPEAARIAGGAAAAGRRARAARSARRRQRPRPPPRSSPPARSRCDRSTTRLPRTRPSAAPPTRRRRQRGNGEAATHGVRLEATAATVMLPSKQPSNAPVGEQSAASKAPVEPAPAADHPAPAPPPPIQETIQDGVVGPAEGGEPAGNGDADVTGSGTADSTAIVVAVGTPASAGAGAPTTPPPQTSPLPAVPSAPAAPTPSPGADPAPSPVPPAAAD